MDGYTIGSIIAVLIVVAIVTVLYIRKRRKKSISDNIETYPGPDNE